MYCAYETMPIDGVVDRGSATAMCNQSALPIIAKHIDLVKPCDKSDVAYVYLKMAIENDTEHPSNGP